MPLTYLPLTLAQHTAVVGNIYYGTEAMDYEQTGTLTTHLTSGMRLSLKSFSNKWNIVLTCPTTSKKYTTGSDLGSASGIAACNKQENNMFLIFEAGSITKAIWASK